MYIAFKMLCPEVFFLCCVLKEELEAYDWFLSLVCCAYSFGSYRNVTQNLKALTWITVIPYKYKIVRVSGKVN